MSLIALFAGVNKASNSSSFLELGDSAVRLQGFTVIYNQVMW